MLLAICASLLPGVSIEAIAQVAHTSYFNFVSLTTSTIKTGAGVLASLCVNTATASETITIYDSATGSGTKIGTITLYASTNPCFYYNVNFFNGLTLVAATASSADITVGYQ